MIRNVTSAFKLRGILSARRLVLLAGVGAVGIAALMGGSGSTALQPWALAASPARAAEARPAGFADVAEKVMPAVISIRAKVLGAQDMMSQGDESGSEPGSPGHRFFRRFGLPDGQTPNRPRGDNFVIGQGSGFFISADGYAVTNNHVVEKAKSLEIRTADGRIYEATVVGTDPKSDLALIKVEGRADFAFVKFAEGAPRVGDWVLAVGNPFGLAETVTAGIVSARGRDIGAGPYDDFIQIDAPVNKGNSGGPAFDVEGNVIGVNTAIISPTGGSVGIAFAIPSDTARTVIAQLKDKGAVTRGWMGVQIQPVTADIAEGLGLKGAEGALVADTQPGSPAREAGLLPGDVITAVNGQTIKDAHDLARRISAMAPESTAKLAVLRKGEAKAIAVRLGELPKERQARAGTDDEHGRAGSDPPRLGMTLAPAGMVAGVRDVGVAVIDVSPNGPAAEHGIKAGDVILNVGDKTVSTPADVRKALDEARSANKRTVLMRVKSGDAMRFVALPVAST